MSIYAWVAALICIAGTVVNVWRINACFVFWFVGEVMWAVFDWRSGLVSRLILDILGIVLAALGAYRNIIKPRRAKNGN
jgi:hypothetical protein